jgi:sugar phosphate isomerase/epimerase
MVGDMGVEISGLGFYPTDYLSLNEVAAGQSFDHLKRLVDFSAAVNVGQVNTFVGREKDQTLEATWEMFDRRWPEMIEYAAGKKVRIGIENCRMEFTRDEWPGGKNAGFCQASWAEMHRRAPSPFFGHNYDMAHPLWQFMNPVADIRWIGRMGKMFHVHLKDVQLHRQWLQILGTHADPLAYHTPRIPGHGDADWDAIFAAFDEIEYEGPMCIELEDPLVVTLEQRIKALLLARDFIRFFLVA